MKRIHRNIILLILIVLMEFGTIPEIHTIGSYINDSRITYKFTGDTVTLEALLSSCLILPLLTICGVEFGLYWTWTQRFRKRGERRWTWVIQSLTLYWDYLSGFLLVFFLTCVIKALVGEPRPHFLDTCKPNQPPNCTHGFILNYKCTNTELSDIMVKDSTKSFPSGHASLSVYLLTFCGWYLHERLVGMAALLGAWLQVMLLTWTLLCCVSRIVDHRHHWWDVLVGAVLGATLGVYTVYTICSSFRSAIRRKLYTKSSETSFRVKSGYDLTKENYFERKQLITSSDASKGRREKMLEEILTHKSTSQK